MNLTTKRMLQFMTVCAGACALSATATVTWVSDNFEAEGDGTTNATPVPYAIGAYKMIVSGAQNQDTNLAWSAVAGDGSAIVAGANDDFSATSRPIPGATTAQVLNLETEGQTLSRVVTNSSLPTLSFENSDVYVDTLIQFTPSEDTPTIGTDVKVAVYVNASTNLVIYHSAYDGFNVFPTNSVIPGLISTNWHRLTIQMGNPDNVGTACKIYLDGGAALTHANAFVDVSPPVGGGEWFMTASNGQTLSAVAFQGTGAVDELVVADGVTFESTTGILLTLVFEPTQLFVTTSGVSVATGTQVETDTPVEITALPWYEISSFGALFVGGDTTNKVSGTAMITNINGTVASGVSATNEITAVAYTETGSISTGLGGSYPANKVASWALANSLTALTTDMEDDYLFNVAPGTEPMLKITSIVHIEDPVKSTIAVTVTNAPGVVNFQAINGSIAVTSTSDLGSTFGPVGTYTVTATNVADVVIDVLGNDAFIKAVVQ